MINRHTEMFQSLFSWNLLLMGISGNPHTARYATRRWVH